MGRAPCCEKVGLKRGRWTAEEDEILVKYIQTHGEGSWRSLPKNAGLKRCGKSCRLRWMNYLRTDVKRGNISPEEEEIIIKLHATLGNRWSLIAGHLPGRTDNEIKNYWNSHLSRRIQTFRKFSVGEPVIVDLGKLAAGCKRRGGRTSRSAMKKNSFVTVTRKFDDRATHLHKLMTNNNFHSPLTVLQRDNEGERKPNDGVRMNMAGLDVVLGADFIDPQVDTSTTGSGDKLGFDNNDDCFWGSKEMEDFLLGSTTTEATSATSCVTEDRNNAVLNKDDETREKLLEVTREGSRDEEVGSLLLDELMDCGEMEGSNMWNDDEQIWPWFWYNNNNNNNNSDNNNNHSDTGVLEFGGVVSFDNTGCQDELVDAWLF